MAAGDLIFGGLTICNVNTGVGTPVLKDSYNRQPAGKAQAVYQEVVYANTQGRTLQTIGSQNSRETSEGVAFTGSIYAATETAMVTFLNSINTMRTNPAQAFGTLQWSTSLSIGNMFWAEWTHSGIRACGGAVRITFSARFEQFAQ